jgi:hypothetical protein
MESDKEISSVDMRMVAEIRATAQESADRGLLFATKW